MDGNKSKNFDLRCSLSGHDHGVRRVATLSQPEGAFVSVCTGRIVVWTPENDGPGFIKESEIQCRCNTIHSMCVVAPNDEHPSGLILLGTDEPSIQAYVVPSGGPIYTLKGHSDIICALSAGRYGTLVSGSWDKTAKVWYKQKSTMTLAGHEGAVLSVVLAPAGGYMLTGSADSTIKRWKAGKCEHTFEGHTDWVRGLCILTQSEFLSCSNDGTVRRWNITGGCIQTYKGHSGFVLDLACLPDGRGFVSVGDGGNMCFWKDGKQVEAVMFENQPSVSSVCALPNGDVVTGASDNQVRVYTMDFERIAARGSLEMRGAVRLETESTESKEKDRPSEKKVSSLGEEVLHSESHSEDSTSGTVDCDAASAVQEQQVSDRDESSTRCSLQEAQTFKAEANSCSLQEAQTFKAEATSATSSSFPGAQKLSSRNVVFEGKEYDFVFDVELKEGEPPLKLPYVRTESPESAAQTFLDRHGLSQRFLKDVIDFIRKEAPVTPGDEKLEHKDSDSSQNPEAVVRKKSPGEYFPETSFIVFENLNKKGVFTKLREFNFEASKENWVSKAEMELLELLVSGLKEEAAEATLSALWKLLKWQNPDFLFPALDILRFAMLNKYINQLMCSADDGKRFIDYVSSILSTRTSPPRNQLLVLRALCNTFQHAAGERLMLSNYDRLASDFLVIKSDSEPRIQTAQSSLLLNFVIAYCRAKDIDGKMQCLAGAATLSQSLTDSEAFFRLLVAIGTAVVEDRACHKLVRSLDLQNFLNMCCCDDLEKVRCTAESITKRIS